jgi:hypothetical protein
MSQEFTRRTFLKHISAAGLLSLVVYEPSWLFAEEVDQRWKGISKLDGSLLLDEGQREQMATDFGANFHRVPSVVLQPRSAEDLVKIVRPLRRSRRYRGGTGCRHGGRRPVEVLASAEP